jgi:SHS2 domain-containing protein
MGYRFVDHTADVAADVTGGTPADLFFSAAQALTDTVTDLSTVRPVVTQSVTLESGSLEDLLVDWLNELVFRFEVRNMLLCQAALVIDRRSDRWHLAGTTEGEPFDPGRHPSRVLVKAATYHGLSIAHTDGEWRARIVFDI